MSLEPRKTRKFAIESIGKKSRTDVCDRLKEGLENARSPLLMRVVGDQDQRRKEGERTRRLTIAQGVSREKKERKE